MYHLNAEWAPQDAVMLTWPHQDTDWAPLLNEVEPVYLALAHHITQVQTLVIVCHNEALRLRVSALLQNADISLSRCRLLVVPCDDTWARDHGPISVQDANGIRMLDFTFNGWGDKYQSQLDNNINAALHQSQAAHTRYEKVDMVLEGGGIESDGQGCIMTTKHCLLNPNRNPHLQQSEIEDALAKYLGAKKVLWLSRGHLEGDDTDAHIDTLARFAPDNAIVYVACDDKNDSHYDELSAMAEELSQLTNAQGDAFALHALPWPQAKYNDEGERLPATYANYLIINEKVLVPTYRDEADAQALEVIARAYPKHQVIGVDCLPLIHQFGSLHCITMQLPQGFLSEIDDE